MEASPLDAVLGQPTLNSIRNLVDQLAAFASHFAATGWEGKHGFLPLVLTETKTFLADWNQDLDCGRIKNPELLNPKIWYDTKGWQLLQLQEDHKVNWK